MPERLDLGPCTAIRHSGSRDRSMLLLPGQFYPTRAPVLWFAREAATARGWSTVEVLGEPGMHQDPLGWERDCAERVLGSVAADCELVVGKSLASLLAEAVNDRDLPAAWLTPLMTEPAVVAALGHVRRPTLLVGGTADRLWDRSAVPDNPALEVAEIDDADHALQIPGDPPASLRALEATTRAVGRLLDLLGSGRP